MTVSVLDLGARRRLRATWAIRCLLAVWARLADRQPRSVRATDGAWPSISIVLAARNEAARLPARIANLLEQDYPGRREIIVVSDGSTDGPRHGAGAASAAAVRADRGARPAASRWRSTPASPRRPATSSCSPTRGSGSPPTPWSALVANFADPAVGGATGELVLDCERRRASTSTSRRRRRPLLEVREVAAPQRERASGRRSAPPGRSTRCGGSCWRPLPADTLLDDVLAPMRAVLAGCRVVFEERARAFDRASRRRRRGVAPQDAHARRQLPDPRAGAAAARAVRQPGLAAVRVAQDRPAARPLGAARARSSSSAALAPSSWFYFAGVLRAGRLLRARRPSAPGSRRASVARPPRTRPDADGAQCR